MCVCIFSFFLSLSPLYTIYSPLHTLYSPLHILYSPLFSLFFVLMRIWVNANREMSDKKNKLRFISFLVSFLYKQ